MFYNIYLQEKFHDYYRFLWNFDTNANEPKVKLLIELTNHELTHSCRRIKERYFCEQKAVVKRPRHRTYITSLLRQNNDNIFKIWSMQLTNIDEKTLQLNTSTFLIYSETEKQIFVTCIRNEEKIKKQFTLKDMTYLTMKNKCTAIMDNSIISSNLPINYDIYLKCSRIDIDFKSVVGLEDEEFSKFLIFSIRNYQSLFFAISLQ